MPPKLNFVPHTQMLTKYGKESSGNLSAGTKSILLGL